MRRILALLAATVLATVATAQPPLGGNKATSSGGGGSITITGVVADCGGIPAVFTPDQDGDVTVPAGLIPSITDVGVIGTYAINPPDQEWGAGVRVGYSVGYWDFSGGWDAAAGCGGGTFEGLDIAAWNANDYYVRSIQVALYQERWNGTNWEWRLLCVAEVGLIWPTGTQRQ